MPRAKWRTVAANGSTNNHPSQPAAYDWCGRQPAEDQFRVEIDDGDGRWQWYSTVRSIGFGFEEI
jgi:hypothetical protein